MSWWFLRGANILLGKTIEHIIFKSKNSKTSFVLSSFSSRTMLQPQPSSHSSEKNLTCSINQLFLALTPSDSLIARYQQNRMPAAAAVSQNAVKLLAKLHFFCLLKENKLKFKRHIAKWEEDTNSNSVIAVVITFFERLFLKYPGGKCTFFFNMASQPLIFKF